MSSASPERPATKITYLGRKRRNASTKEAEGSDSEDNSESVEPSPQTPAKSSMGTGSMKPPGSSSKKKVDFRTPDLPVKHKPTSSHVRTSSSVSSLKNASLAGTPSPGKSSEKRFNTKPLSSASQVSPEDSEIDDGASVAESFISLGRVRRTETERILFFKNQAECDPDIEPHRVKCLRCRKSISLGKKTTYAVKPWEQHRLRCDQQVYNFDDMASVTGSVAPSVGGSEVNTNRGSRKSLAERKAILDSDPRAQEVQADQVLCKRCGKWIRLSSKHEYILANWNAHQQTCSDSKPSSRITAADNRMRLVNDPQAKRGESSVSPHHVDCRYCGSRINLEGAGEYNPTSWEEHKKKCKRLVQPSIRPEPESGNLNTLTEASVTTGVKRGREEAEQEEGEHPNNRTRSESYQAPTQEAPGPFGWFMAPIKAFVRGFRDSIQHEATQ